MKGQTNSQI